MIKTPDGNVLESVDQFKDHGIWPDSLSFIQHGDFIKKKKNTNQMTLLKKSIVAYLSFPDVANCSFISSNKYATGFGVSVTVASVVRLRYT